MKSEGYLGLRKQLLELSNLDQINNLLDWDQNVNVPHGGHVARASLMGYVAGLYHRKFTSKEFEKILMKAVGLAESGKLQDDETFIVMRVLSDFEKARKLPSEFVEKLTQLCGEAYEVWVQARKKSDFSIFEPYLTIIVEYKRREADYIGYSCSPYDALLGNFEEGLTAEAVSEIFEPLRGFLAGLINKIKHSGVEIDNLFLGSYFPIREQRLFAMMAAKKIGFDFTKGRLDTSVHPFCASLHPADVRITTRYEHRDFFNQGFFSVIHEAGHGLYDQGLLSEYFGTPLGDAISLGIHESQSRLWENHVGHSLPFWVYFYPRLVEYFPRQLGSVSLPQLYKAINIVEPGFIRTDSDEVTYNLHVMLRFEIEKGLIEGDIAVKDLPSVWNQKMKEYFDLDVPDDARGVLQDGHWSDGSFGYFPTYTLGNIYAAQFFSAAQTQISDLGSKMGNGDFGELREWLRKNIHVRGRLYLPEHLVFRVTGEKPSSRYLVDYLNKKYSEIYEL